MKAIEPRFCLSCSASNSTLLPKHGSTDNGCVKSNMPPFKSEAMLISFGCNLNNSPPKSRLLVSVSVAEYVDEDASDDDEDDSDDDEDDSDDDDASDADDADVELDPDPDADADA